MKVTIKGYIVGHHFSWEKQPSYSFHANPLDSSGFVTVMPHEFEVDVPEDFNLIAAQVASLEKTKEEFRAEFNKRVAYINDQISRLQCLEFNPS